MVLDYIHAVLKQLVADAVFNVGSSRRILAYSGNRFNKLFTQKRCLFCFDKWRYSSLLARVNFPASSMAVNKSREPGFACYETPELVFAMVGLKRLGIVVGVIGPVFGLSVPLKYQILFFLLPLFFLWHVFSFFLALITCRRWFDLEGARNGWAWLNAGCKRSHWWWYKRRIFDFALRSDWCWKICSKSLLDLVQTFLNWRCGNRYRWCGSRIWVCFLALKNCKLDKLGQRLAVYRYVFELETFLERQHGESFRLCWFRLIWIKHQHVVHQTEAVLGLGLDVVLARKIF